MKKLLQNVAILTQGNEQLKTLVTEKATSLIEYSIDEEKLVRETDWIVKSKFRATKKRKPESSPEVELKPYSKDRGELTVTSQLKNHSSQTIQSASQKEKLHPCHQSTLLE